MEYTQVLEAIEDAWFAFYRELELNGFTSQQVKAFKTNLDRKDVYNAVDQCAVEAVL